MKRALSNWVAFGLSVVAVLAVAVAIQSWAEILAPRFDLTPRQRLTLTPFARQILEQGRRPLEIENFHERDARSGLRERVALFEADCPNLHVKLTDLDREPQRARDAGVARYDQAVLRYQGRQLVAAVGNESMLAAAILRAMTADDRVLYFVSGHGERSPGGAGEDQLGQLARALRNEGFVVHTLPLLQAREIPSDAAAVVLAGPEVDPLEHEIAALEGYLARGGSVLALIDPAALPHLESWVATHGMALGDDVVIDRVNRLAGTEGTDVVVPQWRDHPIFAGHEGAAVLGRARGVELIEGSRATLLARTMPQSFLAAGAQRMRAGVVELDPLTDRRGPIGVMGVAVVERAEGERPGRLVVVGDADFATDNYLALAGNQDVVLRTIDWLVDREATGARGHDPDVNQRPLSPILVSARLSEVILWGGAVAWPALFVVVGALVALVRRRRR